MDKSPARYAELTKTFRKVALDLTQHCSDEHAEWEYRTGKTKTGGTPSGTCKKCYEFVNYLWWIEHDMIHIETDKKIGD